MKKLCLIVCFIMLITGLSFAQETPKAGSIGITAKIVGFLEDSSASYYLDDKLMMPANYEIGLKIYLLDCLSLDPTLLFNNKTYTSSTSKSICWLFGGGLNVCYYFSPASPLSIYLSPGASYKGAIYDVQNSTNDLEGSVIEANLKIGLQYSFNSHFSIFTDIGACFQLFQYKSSPTANPESYCLIGSAGNKIGIALYL